MPKPVCAGGMFALSLSKAGAIAALCLFAVFGILAGEPSKSPGEVVFDQIIEDASARHGVDPLLVKALIWRESRFKPLCTGSCGEVGLMQIRACVAEDWALEHGKEIPAREELFSPSLNIEIGTWHLARALQRWKGSLRLALSEYNAGRRTLLKWLRKAGYDSCAAIEGTGVDGYVNAVREKYSEYSAIEAGEQILASAFPVPQLLIE